MVLLGMFLLAVTQQSSGQDNAERNSLLLGRRIGLFYTSLLQGTAVARVQLRVEDSLMKTVDSPSAGRVNFRCFVSRVSNSFGWI
jgi:hypothetical protein